MVHFILENTDILVQNFSIIGALIGAGASLVGGLLGNKAQKDANKVNAQQNEMMMRFNREEAEKTRNFNAEEAQKQRDYEAKMSNTEMSRRVADLRAAGFNPALMGATPSGASTPSGAAASAGSASAGSLTPMTPVTGLADSISQSGLTASQIAVNNASAHKMEAEAKNSEADLSWKDKLNGASYDVQTQTARVHSSQAELNEKHKDEVDSIIKLNEQKIEQIREQIEEVRSHINSMDVHAQRELLDYALNTREVEAKIKELASQTELNYTNARDIVATRSARILGLQMSAYSSEKQGDLYDGQAGKIKVDAMNGQLDFEIRSENKDWEVFKGKADVVTGILGDAVGSVTDAINLKRLISSDKEKARSNRAHEAETERHNRAEESRRNYETGYRHDENERRQEKHDAWKAKKNRKSNNTMMDRFTYTR